MTRLLLAALLVTFRWFVCGSAQEGNGNDCGRYGYKNRLPASPASRLFERLIPSSNETKNRRHLNDQQNFVPHGAIAPGVLELMVACRKRDRPKQCVRSGRR